MNDSQQLLQPGTPCTLEGLQGQPAFNGITVTIVELLYGQGRYRVKPMDPNSPLPPVLAIKPKNLRPLGAPIQQQAPDENLSPQAGGSPMGHLYPPGARFVLQGLQAQPTFNGQHVLIIEYLHDQGRYRVQPADPNGLLPPVLAIRPQNLAGPPTVPTQQGQFSPGDRFMLQGSQTRPTYNGQHVLVLEYLPDQGRYRVQPADPNGTLPPVLSIRPENLVPAAGAGPPAGQAGLLLLPGAPFVLQSFHAQPAFNGHRVLIMEYLHDQHRYRVQPEDPNGPLPPVLTIRAQNLIPASAAVGIGKKQSSSRSLLKLWKKQSKFRKDVCHPLLPTHAMQRSSSVPSFSVEIPPRVTKQRSQRSLPSASKHASMPNDPLTPPAKQTSERNLLGVLKPVPSFSVVVPPRVTKQRSHRSLLSSFKEPPIPNGPLAPVARQTSQRNLMGVSKRSSESDSELLGAINDIERQFLVAGVTASSNNQKSDSELLEVINGIERQFLVTGVTTASSTNQKSDSDLVTRKSDIEREFIVTGVTTSSTHQKTQRPLVTAKKQTSQRSLVGASKALNGETATTPKYLEDDIRNHVKPDPPTTMAVELKISSIARAMSVHAMPKKTSGQLSPSVSQKSIKSSPSLSLSKNKRPAYQTSKSENSVMSLRPGVDCHIKPFPCLTSSRSHSSLPNIDDVFLTTPLNTKKEKLRSGGLDDFPSTTKQKNRSNKKKNESRPPENWDTSNSNWDSEPCFNDDGFSIYSVNELYTPPLRPTHVSKTKLLSAAMFRTTKNKKVSSDATATTHNTVATATSSRIPA
jgi:hypothetical protein